MKSPAIIQIVSLIKLDENKRFSNAEIKLVILSEWGLYIPISMQGLEFTIISTEHDSIVSLTTLKIGMKDELRVL